MLEFDSLNPYQRLETISAGSLEELVVMVRAIKTPIKIVSVHSNATMTSWKALVCGDVRAAATVRKQKTKIKEQ
jgi:hypothetical protein